MSTDNRKSIAEFVLRFRSQEPCPPDVRKRRQLQFEKTKKEPLKKDFPSRLPRPSSIPALSGAAPSVGGTSAVRASAASSMLERPSSVDTPTAAGTMQAERPRRLPNADRIAKLRAGLFGKANGSGRVGALRATAREGDARNGMATEKPWTRDDGDDHDDDGTHLHNGSHSVSSGGRDANTLEDSRSHWKEAQTLEEDASFLSEGLLRGDKSMVVGGNSLDLQDNDVAYLDQLAASILQKRYSCAIYHVVCQMCSKSCELLHGPPLKTDNIPTMTKASPEKPIASADTSIPAHEDILSSIRKK